MRTIFFSMISLALVAISCVKNDDDQDLFTEETISMGASSASDVYYSLSTGVVNTVDRNSWDIAFSVPLQTATILINEGSGVELYCAGDTNDWASIDEIAFTDLKPLYNDESDWLKGAFNINATGFPNYGWGTYHQGVPDHNVGGDSVFIIRLSDASYKKIMIRAKLGATAANIIRWADLDGSNENTIAISTTPYNNAKHFIHYSLVNKEVVEAEPDLNNWDLLFTRYMIAIPMGPSTFMNHMATGVLSNQGVTVAKVTGMPPEKVLYANVSGYSDTANAIGYDWKSSDPITHVTTVVDSTSYFVKANNGKTYQLYFTNYGGLDNGDITLKIKPIE